MVWSRSVRWRSIACVALCCAFAQVAVAQEPPAQEPPAQEPPADSPERARALELGRQGLALYNERRWVEAYERFERAEALVHSPVFVLYMARSKRELRELRNARVLYGRIAAPAEPNEPETWQVARREAESELELLRPRIPTVRIVTAAARVWLDGASIATRVLEIDPGEHEVVARMKSGELVRKSFVIEEGERDLRIELVAPRRAAPRPRPVADDPGKTQRIAGIALMATGGVLVSVGIGTGIAAVVKDGQLEDACTEGVCPEANRADVDAYYAVAHTTTVMLSVGGAALATGVVVYLTAPSHHLEVAPFIGPGVAGFFGRY
jgi:hypothetical protein